MLNVRGDVHGGPCSSFVFGRKIALDGSCEDFSVVLRSVDFGKYSYLIKDCGRVATYCGEADRSAVSAEYMRKTGGKGFSAAFRSAYKTPVFIWVASAILLLALLLVNLLQLADFKETADGFGRTESFTNL